MKHEEMGRSFGSQGPEGYDEHESKPTELNGAKGGGMKHVVSPGADGHQKKHQQAIAMIRAMLSSQGPGGPGGMPPMGGAPAMAPGMGGGY